MAQANGRRGKGQGGARALALRALALAGLWVAACPGGASAQVDPCPVFNDPARAAIEESDFAKEMAEWAKKLEALQSGIDTLGEILNVTKTGLDTIDNDVKKLGVVTSAGQEAQADLATRLINAEITWRTQDAIREAKMNAAADSLGSKNNHQLCRKLKLDEAKYGKPGQSREIARVVMSAYMNDRSGNGPKAAAIARKVRCDNKIGSALFGDPSECVGPEGTGDKKPLQGAYLTAHTLSMFGGPLVFPHFENGTYDYNGVQLAASAPKPKTEEEKRWVAGFHYCLGLGNYSPNPPAGKEIETPDGVTTAAQHVTCKAQGASLVWACAKLLGYYSRPPAISLSAVKADEEFCKTASVFLGPETIEKLFDNCKKGLSQAEVDYINRMSCLTANFQRANLVGGAQTHQSVDMVLECGTQTTFDLLEEQKMNKTLIDAINGLPLVDECWPEGGGEGGGRIQA